MPSSADSSVNSPDSDRLAGYPEELIKVATCSVCLGLLKCPKILPKCGHTFCLNCIIGAIGGATDFICPECRSVNSLPRGPQGLNTNLVAQQLVSTLQGLDTGISDSNLAVPSRCGHVGQKSRVSCGHCGMKFCRSCEIVHIETVKVQTLESARIVAEFNEQCASGSESWNDTLASVKTCVHGKVQTVQAEAEAHYQQLKDRITVAIDSKKDCTLQRIREIGNGVLAQIDDAVDKAKEAKVQTSTVDVLSKKSCLALDLEEVSKCFNEVGYARKTIESLSSLKSSIDSSIFVFKSSSTVEDAIWKEPAEPSVKWLGAEDVEIERIADVIPKLRKAVDVGDLTPVVELINKSWPPSVMQSVTEDRDVDDGGKTLLHRASVKGHVDVVKFLIKDCHADSFARCEINNGNSVTALHLAALSGHSATVRFLLGHDPRLIKEKDSHGATALEHAAYMGQLDAVKVFLEHSDVNLENQGEAGRTALLYAVSSGRRNVVELLVEKGADVFAKDNQGMTALHLASFFSFGPVVSYLLKVAPELAVVKNNFNDTAYLLAKNNNKMDIASLFNINIVTSYPAPRK